MADERVAAPRPGRRPRDDVRFAFRKPESARQFQIEFPHDTHQDVIAQRFTEVPNATFFVRASFSSRRRQQHPPVGVVAVPEVGEPGAAGPPERERVARHFHRHRLHRTLAHDRERRLEFRGFRCGANARDAFEVDALVERLPSVSLGLLLTQVEINAGLPIGHIGIEAQIETARGLINV